MIPPLNLDPDALWQQRYRVPVVAATQIAGMNPTRGLTVTNLSGVYQLHAWDITTGTLRQITAAPAGVVFGGISPDGAWIYYLQDKQGDEIGHYVRVPFTGDAHTPRQDLTPHLDPYASFALTQSLSGRVIGFTAAGREGFRMYTVLATAQADGTLATPQLLYQTLRLAYGPVLSFDAEYAVVVTTEASQYTDTSLRAFNLTTADPQQKVLGLAESEGSLTPVAFAPLLGDTRLLANTNVTGFERPLIWDVASGDRTDLPLLGMDGDISALGWSPDGEKLLLLSFAQAHYQLYIYDLTRSTLHKLNHPPG
ncbi:MAG: hypothetical protein H7Y11_08540, partial [Armatimonadetes bacterium]|nr:hypothetical protein [Anaerolineae bacterium]